MYMHEGSLVMHIKLLHMEESLGMRIMDKYPPGGGSSGMEWGWSEGVAVGKSAEVIYNVGTYTTITFQVKRARLWRMRCCYVL